MKFKKFTGVTDKARAFAVCSLACIVLLSGCSIFDEYIYESSSQQKTTANAASYADEPVNTEYGYNSLTSDEVKNLYKSIGASVQNTSPQSVSVDGVLDDYLISQAVEAYKNDHPEVFWLLGADSYINYETSTKVQLTYTLEGDELESAQAEFDASVDEIVAAAPQSDAFDMEEYVNDTIIEKCSYDSSAAENDDVLGSESDAYGVLVQGKAVCEGYARAFQLLCNRLNIDCVVLSGTAEGVNHAWNCVKIGGEWYQMDVTWNDTDGVDEYTQNYYFNLTDSLMYEDHTVSPKYSEVTSDEYEELTQWCNLYVPVCTSTEYAYFTYKYPTVSGVDDGESVASAVAEAAQNGEKYFNIVLNTDDFDSMYDMLLNDGYLSQWVADANEINSHSPEISETCYVYVYDTLNLLTIEMDYVS